MSLSEVKPTSNYLSLFLVNRKWEERKKKKTMKSSSGCPPHVGYDPLAFSKCSLVSDMYITHARHVRDTKFCIH